MAPRLASQAPPPYPEEFAVGNAHCNGCGSLPGVGTVISQASFVANPASIIASISLINWYTTAWCNPRIY